MKKRHIALRNMAALTLLVSCFIACDKDFAEIDSDIINTDNASHFGVTSRDFDVIAYTKTLEPVQTNDLPIYMLGVYNDPTYGNTTASIVSQISSTTLDPDFGNDVVLDSVVLNIPYFSTPINVTDDGNYEYQLDSIFGDAPIKLSLFESNYFLRDINPESDEDINSQQLYYSNMSTGIDNINSTVLEGQEISVDPVSNDNPIDFNNFIPSSDLTILTDADGTVTGTFAPTLRINLNVSYWYNKIILMSGQPELSNLNNFRNYFRGLYLKAESIGASGNMTLLNLASESANITLYYTSTDPNNADETISSTYILNFTGNRVNFMSNDFMIPSGNENTGDANLYVKGGQGSIAEIKLFNGEDIDEDDTFENVFETFKNEFVETDEDGNFVRSKKLVNEANLVVYVNQNLVNGEEPERLFLYDVNNQSPLPDYYFDAANTTYPVFSRVNHLGRLQRQGDNTNGDGIKYKIRITEHINNLLLRDSTNVKLGLAVSGNVNLENNFLQYDVLTTDNTEESVPLSSIVSPRGTILYGNMVGDEEKKLYLEIIFTEPDN